MELILDKIEGATETEIHTIMDAVQDWYAAAYPQWDILYLALPKEDPSTRKKLLRQAMELLGGEQR